MKVKFNKDTLLLCINRSLGCVSADKTYGAIEGILLTAIAPDQCRISAYDLEKGIKTTIDAEVEEVKEEKTIGFLSLFKYVSVFFDFIISRKSKCCCCNFVLARKGLFREL